MTESDKTALDWIAGGVTAATVFGHAPLIFVTGAGAEARKSIGIVLVAGMTVGTLFTLFVVPAFYSIIAAKHRPHEEIDEEELEIGTVAHASSVQA